jgi:hypothetical protein
MLGFVLHQAYRTLFEAFRGWESPRRPVLALIRDAYGIGETQEHTPYLIWEITFYSDDLPGPFRDHVRGVWHYIMSFRSVSFAAGLSAVALIVPWLLKLPDRPSLLAVAGFVLLAALFWLKARLTYLSLGRQELVAFQRYREAFDKVQRAIHLDRGDRRPA